MPSTDDRIVKMEFDNAAFERKLETTLTSLGQLDKALKLTGATKGLEDVSQAAGKLSFGSISEGIEGISKGFIAMSTVAITALSNITSHALMAGANVVKAFSFAPVLDGFREYETQLNSVQTILANTASKGTTLDQVNDALQQLNTYSDQTIYNFGQMARNIGTFTAAGVDLNTSVSSIKGIANLAAMSGSSADQASTAMYQLSQAIATGSVHLMDWNSVVNAGMGGEAFKSALFETQKAMGNVLHVPVGQTFTEWEDAGNSFRDTLQDGWITADVLTTTLSAFTGDMTEEMLLQKGFTEAQATNILKTAAMAKAAATEVKTFTQLIGTVKEAVGTGWADSFKIIIGNFNEAKQLWTGVNNAIGGFVQKTSDARNQILQGWKDFGGRTALIETLKSAFHTFAEVLGTVREAFSDIFPPVTAATLLRLTDSFRNLVTEMIPSIETIGKIKAIFTGFFAALSIGWEIIKEGAKFLIGLGKSLLGLVTPEASDFLVKLSGGLVKLQEALVKGGGIKDFFANLTRIIQKPIEMLGKFKDAIGHIFDLFDTSVSDKVGDSVGRLGDRFGSLKDVFSRIGDIWQPFEDALMKVVAVLDAVWQVIKDWFSKLGDKIADIMGEGSFNNVFDALNTGLLAGIALLLARFFKNGFKFDLGGGFFEKLSGSLEQLTGVFKAMQANIRANVLLKIAGAIAILTASVVVLSMIDSVALTRALSAMAVGFGQLIGAFALLNKMDVKSVAKMSFIAATLIMLGAAMLILSVAVKILSTLSWDEMLRGLVGVTSLLVILSGAAKLLSKNADNMISAGVGIAAISAGLILLAIAMKIFATMSWEEMGKGLVGVAGGLGLLVAAIRLMPDDKEMIRLGVSLILISVGLGLMAATMKIFATMSWEEMGKGLVGVAAGLGLMVVALRAMPEDMGSKAAGLLIASVALVAMGIAIKMLSKLSWEELAKGLVGVGVAMAILVIAAQQMEKAIPGAGAMVVVAGAMLILAVAMKIMGSMSWGDIAKGLVIITVAILGFAAAAAGLSEVLPAMIGLGVALVLLGGGIALIGVGLFLLGKGLESIAAAGPKAAAALDDILISVGKSLPALLTGLAEGIVEMVQVFSDAAPIFAKAIAALIVSLLDELSTIIPKLGAVIRLLVEEIFKIIRSYGAEYIKTGLFILTKLLDGLRNNIGPITTMVGDIIVNFLNAFQEQVPRVAKELADTIILMFTTAAYEIGRVSGTLLVGIGKSFIQGLTDGVDSQTGGLMSKIIAIPASVLSSIGDVAMTLWQKGVDFLTGLYNGIVTAAEAVWGFFGEVPGRIGGFFTDAYNWLLQTGKDILQGLWDGITNIWDQAYSWIKEIRTKIFDAFPSPGEILKWIGEKIFGGLWEGMKDAWPAIKEWVLDKVNWIKDAFKTALRVLSPSRVMMEQGQYIMQGLHIGMKKGWEDLERWMENVDPPNKIIESFDTNLSNVLSSVANKMSDMDDMSPVITPVLDLTKIEQEAKKIGGLVQSTDKITPNFSIGQARVISSIQTAPVEIPEVKATNPQGPLLVQNNYSPTQLSTTDIYKQTRNQIRIAKEELSIS